MSIEWLEVVEIDLTPITDEELEAWVPDDFPEFTGLLPA